MAGVTTSRVALLGLALALAACGAEESAGPDSAAEPTRASAAAYPSAPGPESDAAWLATLPSPDPGSRQDLHEAAALGDVAAVRHFAEVIGVPLDEPQGDFRQTPLHYAAGNGHLDVARYLLAKGADIDAIDRTGQPPLAGALGRSHPAVAEFLIARGADLGIRGEFGGMLHFAAGGSDLAAARHLLALGFDVDEEAGDYGMRPMCSAGHSGTPEMIRFLIEHGAGSVQEACGSSQRTVLHEAADGGNVDGARVLIEHGHDPNGRPSSGRTPLHIAIEKRDVAFVQLLLEHGADKHRRDWNGKTAVELASESRYEAVISLLAGS